MPKKEYRVFGLLGFFGIFLFYVFGVAGPVLAKEYMFSGDGYHLWSFWYLIFYSIREYGELPWWDPMAYNGFPLYYHFLSGWFNILDPYYVPLLLSFWALPNAIPISDYYVFSIAVYPAFLNSFAVYLIARELTRKPHVALVAPTIFLFSQYTVLAFHDPFAYQAITGALFLLYGVVAFEKHPSESRFWQLLFFFTMFILGFHFGTLMSAAFWASFFIFIYFLLSKRLRQGLFICIKEIVEKRRTRWIALLGVTSIVLAVVAVWIPVAENGDDVLRYRGEPIVTNDVSQKYASVYWEPEGEQIGRIGLTWSPLKSLYDNLPGTSGRLENGHDYRYVGMVTAVFGFAALLFARNASLVASLLATFLFVNGFLIYTTENIFFEFLRSHSDLISSIRNTETILPRGGASIMLMLLAVIGIDGLYKRDRRIGVQTSRGMLLGGFALFSTLTLLVVVYFRIFDPINKGFFIQSGTHIAVYVLLFAAAGMGLLFSIRGSHKAAWVGTILILVIFDGVTSLSSRMGGELSSGNVWPHQWDARIPYNELERRGMILQDDLKFNAFVKASDAMFPITYRSGAYHNSTEINSARREWLEVYGMDSDRRILLNWNDSTNSVERYPYFLTARDACVLPDDSTLQQVASMAKNRILIKEGSDVSMPNGNCTSSVLKPTIEELTFNRVALETSQAEASFLMFVDNSDRFWTAEVNGEKAEIVEANILYKGVHLPKGKNTVVWNYDPWPIRYIRYAALLGLFVFGLVLLLEHRRRGENALKAL